MNLITRTGKAITVSMRWKNSYYRDYNNEWQDEYAVLPAQHTKKEIYNELINLGDTPNPDDIDRVIGNSSWTSTTCNECQDRPEIIIELSGEFNDGPPTYICKLCLLKALDLINTKE